MYVSWPVVGPTAHYIPWGPFIEMHRRNVLLRNKNEFHFSEGTCLFQFNRGFKFGDRLLSSAATSRATEMNPSSWCILQLSSLSLPSCLFRLTLCSFTYVSFSLQILWRSGKYHSSISMWLYLINTFLKISFCIIILTTPRGGISSGKSGRRLRVTRSLYDSYETHWDVHLAPTLNAHYSYCNRHL